MVQVVKKPTSLDKVIRRSKKIIVSWWLLANWCKVYKKMWTQGEQCRPTEIERSTAEGPQGAGEEVGRALSFVGKVADPKLLTTEASISKDVHFFKKMYFNPTLFTKTGGGPDLACRLTEAC